MAPNYGPKIVTNGLVLALDAANVKSSLKTIEVLVVAAGGGGVPDRGGGGGGGGVLTGTTTVTNQNYTITVGNGANGVTGGNSVAFGLTALGGGAGGSGSGSNGATGGSGGGAGNGSGADLITTGGLGTPGQGYNGGGSVYIAPNYGGGGGGGAGGPGQSGTQLLGGNGGPGIGSVISGTLTYYGGGGGGGSYGGISYPAGTGGIGGGGNGSVSTAQNGSPNTGGGGGSNGVSGGISTSGGSGIVIVRYKGSQRATGGTVTFVNGHTIHTFTTSGTFTPNGAPGSGTVWTDFSNNGNSGIITNGVGYTSANGGSFVFDGVDDKVSTNFKPSGPRSYFIWIKYNSLTHPSGYQLTGTQEGNAYNYIGIINGGNVYYYAGGNGGTISNSTLSPNVWYQQGFALFPDGSRKVYTNGIEINSSAGSLGVTATAEFSIGCINNSYNVNGNISQVSVYNRALSAAEISQNFQAIRGRYSI